MATIEMEPEVMTAAALVVRGEAERLDRLWPGWAERVDAVGLNLGSCAYCVLGQATGDFSEALDRVRDDGYHGDAVYAANAPYREYWRHEIQVRKGA